CGNGPPAAAAAGAPPGSGPCPPTRRERARRGTPGRRWSDSPAVRPDSGTARPPGRVCR
ncbi:hypothetical protein LLOABG_LLOABG_10345, partial [Dysosmobacter welbionis]